MERNHGSSLWWFLKTARSTKPGLIQQSPGTGWTESGSSFRTSSSPRSSETGFHLDRDHGHKQAARMTLKELRWRERLRRLDAKEFLQIFAWPARASSGWMAQMNTDDDPPDEIEFDEEEHTPEAHMRDDRDFRRGAIHAVAGARKFLENAEDHGDSPARLLADYEGVLQDWREGKTARNGYADNPWTWSYEIFRRYVDIYSAGW